MSAEPSSATTRQVLRLASGGESLVVPIDSVREILEVGKLTPMPRAPDFLRGVMNLRGAVVPIIDLASRFGHGASTIGRRSAIVVVECAGDEVQPRVLAGLLVDAVFEVLDFQTTQLESVPSLGIQLPTQYIAGMINLTSGYAALLSLETLLAPADLATRIGAAQEAGVN
ncbi:chemotaxis protein CheW [Inhella gelatinilytica]|uniref:Purine-binding chemotaxis protein CheW n=1 Tax=Inhella gelatinilytica TaxID=2795030 RepID=A0A931ISZ4_9BURK|nr:chemotaxis protein CheW [Inhella gelatinilytica]MBH9552157.1 purine-binding chemotaxis protein CheW [Inhella gelatinilytica]